MDEVGKLIRPDTLTTHFKAFLVRNNLPVIRLHELRHSCASILIASGVSMKAVQEWLGHSTYSTTADIYSHLNFSSKLGIADTLSNIIAGKPVVQAQTSTSSMDAMQKIFASSEIVKAPNHPILPVMEIESLDEESEMEILDEDNKIAINVTAASEDSFAIFQKAKEEMQRLGLENLDEYFEYLEFQERMKQRKLSKSDMEM